MDNQPHDYTFAGDNCDPMPVSYPTGLEFAPVDIPSMQEITEGPDLAPVDPVSAVSTPPPEPVPVAALPDDPLRAELITAEVAAVLALIAHEYFTRPVPVLSVADVAKARREEREKAARKAEASEAEPKVRPSCQIIAFPGRRR